MGLRMFNPYAEIRRGERLKVFNALGTMLMWIHAMGQDDAPSCRRRALTANRTSVSCRQSLRRVVAESRTREGCA